jgi:hypothetical protein
MDALAYEHALLDEIGAQVHHVMADMQERGESPEDLGDARAVARLMVQALPRPHSLGEKVGPFYDTPGLAKWLGVTRQALDARVRNHTLLGLPTSGNGPRVYPVWQFTSDRSVIPHLSDVLRALATGSSDPWTYALWLSARTDDAYAGMSAAEWLAAGRDPATVLAEARADAARWAA